MNSRVNLQIKEKVAQSKIISVGTYLPPQKVTSDQLFSSFDSFHRYDVPENSMSEGMGIIERRMSEPDCKPSDLALPSAIQALDRATDIDKNEIDLVIFCGIERDRPEPATAHTIQKKLGLNAQMAFDLGNACFGFFDAMRVASNLIESGVYRYALITTGEIPTRLITSFVDQLRAGMDIDKAKKIMGYLSVGDAGGSVIIGPTEWGTTAGFKSFDTTTQSESSEMCYYEKGSDGQYDGQMLMGSIVAQTLKLQKRMLSRTFKQLNWDQADYCLTHQVGKQVYDRVTKWGISPAENMIKSYDFLGNITSATFPINYDQLVSDTDCKPGDRICGCYSGSGIVIGQFGYEF